jgi:hypothetical protein
MPERLGAALDLQAPIVVMPAVLHYQRGPVEYYHHVKDGQSNIVICRATWDGIGWLVHQIQVRALVVGPGAHAHFRFEILEHLGDQVTVSIPNQWGHTIRQLPTKSIVFVEEVSTTERARESAR